MDIAIGKRPVSKVRRQFLNKTANGPEPETLDAATRYITNHDVWMIASSIVNTDKNHKSAAIVEFLNSHFNINNINVGNHLKSKIVTLNLEVNKRNVNMPWEYMVQKIGAYDDIRLLSVAMDFVKFNAGYHKAMSTNFGLLPSDNPEGIREIQRIRGKAIRAMREIESRYSFQKTEILVTKDFWTLLSASYNERLLKKIGFTVDSFSSWAKVNGMPTYFDTDNSEYQEMSQQRFSETFQCGNIDAEGVDLGPEFKVPFYDKEGRKKEMGVHFVSLLDLLPEGKFITTYVIIKNKKYKEDKENVTEIFEEDFEFDDIEFVRKTLKKETNINNCDKKLLSI